MAISPKKTTLTLFFSCILILIVFENFKTNTTKNTIDIQSYDITLEISNDTVDVVIDISVLKNIDDNNDTIFFLFNEEIKIDHASINEQNIAFFQKNNSLYLVSQPDSFLSINLRYNLAIDKLPHDDYQIFFERYFKWYPVLYNDFAYYDIDITLNDEFHVFGLTKPQISTFNNRKTYSFNTIDEDFPMLISKQDIFTQRDFSSDSVIFSFYFLPKDSLFLKVVNNKFVYTSDPVLVDSLLNVIYQRSINAYAWYNQNLWPNEMSEINFVEATISNIASYSMGNFVVCSKLMNRELYRKTRFSHEIAHKWIGIHTNYYDKGNYFLGESITEYLSLLYYKSWAGEKKFEEKIEDYRNVGNFLVKFEEVLNQRQHSKKSSIIIYVKGALFVHELNKLIGEEKLMCIIRSTYNKKNKFISLSDFEHEIRMHNCWNEYKSIFEIEL